MRFASEGLVDKASKWEEERSANARMCESNKQAPAKFVFSLITDCNDCNAFAAPSVAPCVSLHFVSKCIQVFYVFMSSMCSVLKEVEKFTARRPQNFHYSKLRRRQDEMRI